MVEAQKSPQFAGKADARFVNSPEQSRQMKESPATPEQKQFHDRYQVEMKRAHEAEKAANQHARDRLKGLTAPELRKIGAKQLLWGLGLSSLNYIGMGIGWLGGVATVFGVGGLAANAAAGTAIASALGIAAIGSIAAVPIGILGGAVAGAELSRHIYNKFARKYDTSLPTLDKTDRIIGDIFSVSGWTPPMVAGVRNIFDGYNQMKSIQ